MSKEIMVLDINCQFLDYIHPALARKVLKTELASVFSRDPFIIQYNKSSLEYWPFKVLISTGVHK
jgi:hypothetical protein